MDEGVHMLREKERQRGHSHEDMASIHVDADTMCDQGVPVLGGPEGMRGQSAKEEHMADQGLRTGLGFRWGDGQQGGPAQRRASLSLSNLSSPRRVPALTFPRTEDAKEQVAAQR